MKPKPFSLLNHLTVPCSLTLCLLSRTAFLPGNRPAPVTKKLRAGRAGLQADDVARLQALLTLDHLERDLIALVEAAVALSDDRGVVDEDVRATLTGDETEALLVIEPLD